jgi:hypothetical protein
LEKFSVLSPQELQGTWAARFKLGTEQEMMTKRYCGVREIELNRCEGEVNLSRSGIFDKNSIFK